MQLDPSLSLQTSLSAIDDLSNANKYIEEILKHICIDSLGVLVDEERKNIIFVLLKNKSPESFFRIILNYDDTLTFVRRLLAKKISIYARFLQGHIIDAHTLHDFEKLKETWNLTSSQESEVNDVDFVPRKIPKQKPNPVNQLEYFIKRIFDFEHLTGRGNDLSEKDKNQIYLSSHGRCMFKGCGAKLNIDEITGFEGTYGVLAHNVAASENSTRGIPFFSYQLSDDPTNILLLCEKHHRLIDKVAGAEYTASRLSQMRSNFIAQCEDLLDSLSFTPMPVYLFFWPVNRNIPQSPSRRDIASCLLPLKSILHKDKTLIHEPLPAHLRASADEFYKKYFLEEFEVQTEQLLRETKFDDKRVAIFGFGPMPCLIALGSKLGNKGKFIPMLMYRDGSCWMWPDLICTTKAYEINNFSEIEDCTEITIRLNLTADPETSKNKAVELGHPVINITAKPEYMGNGAIRNPERGLSFMQDIHALFHSLTDKGITKIHVLPCASNAACIWFGQAFDLHHPEMVIYDYLNNSMVPRLQIRNNGSKNEIAVI